MKDYFTIMRTQLKSLWVCYFIFAGLWVLQGCIPVGVGPTPRTIRKYPDLISKSYRKIYPDSVLARNILIEFPYRQVKEISLSWKVVAGIKLSGSEVSDLQHMILDNVKNYWLYKYPNENITRVALENLTVMDAQILLEAGYPLLLYSAYDIRSRRRPFTFENFDICLGYRGLVNKKTHRISFKLNSGLRGYIDSEAMLTGTLLDVPKLKNSDVQVLQVVVLLPPGQSLETLHELLRKKYAKLGISNFTLPVLEKANSIGSIR